MDKDVTHALRMKELVLKDNESIHNESMNLTVKILQNLEDDLSYHLKNSSAIGGGIDFYRGFFPYKYTAPARYDFSLLESIFENEGYSLTIERNKTQSQYQETIEGYVFVIKPLNEVK